MLQGSGSASPAFMTRLPVRAKGRSFFRKPARGFCYCVAIKQAGIAEHEDGHWERPMPQTLDKSTPSGITGHQQRRLDQFHGKYGRG
jgi:hypothetical protein